ncbi:putative nucleoside-diphosphate-sugar epimerase [Phaeomoniella chlamydospora]|uniref:Putative nucleoside-diphosphate-sugar epimerase n=1 Tax=Phaeomoniella chlamydospora TaxID=158046 RepID=A0A0G2GWV8_PHACM|nr:putative nucleoside-diphosphate-sugar epimerase [Phaeomoniella chlamydospora]
MHLILTGATGLVGTSVLAHVIASSSASSTSRKVTKLSILSRNTNIPYLQKFPLTATSPLEINVIQHKDFESYPSELLKRLEGADGVVWALGVSQNDVQTEAEYVQITKTYAEKAAEAFKSIPNKGQGRGDDALNFVFVSGNGATWKPGIFTPLFGRVKGQTEKSLLEMGQADGALRFYNVRPGAVDPQNELDVQEAIFPKFLNTTTKKALWHVLVPIIRVAYQRGMSPTKEMATVMTDLALGDGQPLQGSDIENEGRTVTTIALRRLGGLS